MLHHGTPRLNHKNTGQEAELVSQGLRHLLALIGASGRMKRVPRKVSEIIKLIEAEGWYLTRTKGSHRQYRHPTRSGTTTVAGKPSDTLHPRAEKSILRQAGI